MTKESYVHLLAGYKLLQDYTDLTRLGVEPSPEAFAEDSLERNYFFRDESKKWKDKAFKSFMKLLVQRVKK